MPFGHHSTGLSSENLISFCTATYSLSLLYATFPPRESESRTLPPQSYADIGPFTRKITFAVHFVNLASKLPNIQTTLSMATSGTASILTPRQIPAQYRRGKMSQPPMYPALRIGSLSAKPV